MNTELEHALRDAVQGEYDLLGELDSGPGWAAVLARATAGHALAVLLLETADDGQLEMEVLAALDDGVAVGHTVCPACAAPGAGWPRRCAGCGGKLPASGDPAAAGLSPGELLDEVRAAAQGDFEVLGALAHPGGGAPLFFARERAGPRIVGLALHADAPGAELALVTVWEPGAAPAHEAPPASLVPVGVEAEDRWSDTPEPVPAAPPEDAWSAPAPVSEPPPSPVFPQGSLRRGRRAGGLAAYAAAGALGVAGVGVLVYLLVVKGPTPAPGSDPPPPETTAMRAVPHQGAGEVTPPAPTPSGGVTTPAAPNSAQPYAPPPPPRPSPAFAPPSAPPAAPVAPPPVPVSTPSVEPPAAAGDETQVTQALARYAAAVSSRQTSRIQAAYPGITPAEIDRWERRFASVNGALQARYELEQAPEITGDVATVVFTLTLEYGGALHPLTMRARLQRGADGGWRLQEVRTL